MKTPPFLNLFGGKTCAAVDRQHPRDMFDVKLLFENEGFTDEIWNGFKVGLISHYKPISELAEINEDVVVTKKKGIKVIENTFEKFELISSHTCRRSVCTNEYLKGTPTIYIMKISGHKTEQAFLKYIKIDEHQAAEKMMEFWQIKKESNTSD